MDAYTRTQLKRSLGKLHNSQPQTERAQSVTSSCINVCKMDEARGLCIGYMRIIDEIASWSTVSDAARLAVWKTLPKRTCI